MITPVPQHNFLRSLPDQGKIGPPLKLSEVWQKLVDPRFGIIRLPIESCRAPEFPELHIAAAVIANSAYFCNNDSPPVKVPMGGAGAGITREQCLWSTLGESVERYCGGIYGAEQFVYAMPEELDAVAFPMHELILYAQSQYQHPNFPFGRLSDQSGFQWVKGRDLYSGEALYLPAQLIYFGLQVGPNEGLTQTMSTGMACGSCYKNAITSGFREVLERDVFMSMWLLRYQPIRLRMDEAFMHRLPTQVQRMLESNLTEIKLWYLPNEFGAVTVLACVEGKYCYRIGLGASCHFSLEAACEKAIVEACHTWVWSTRFSDNEPEIAKNTLNTWGKLGASKEHVSYYLNPENRSHIAFLLDCKDIIDATDLRQQLGEIEFEQVVEKLHASGRKIAWMDLTTADVAETGLCVVKVLISRVQPLYFGNPDCFAGLDPRRLQELAAFWKIPMPGEFNPAPHPFP